MVPALPIRIRCVDSHTEGEPTRTLVDGIPGLVGSPMEVRALLDGAWSPLVRAMMLEPRGYAWLVGAVVLPPTRPGASFGVVFFNIEFFISGYAEGVSLQNFHARK